MPASDDQPTNPFVRFKHYVDAHVNAGLRGVMALPTLIIQNDPETVTARQLGPRDSSSEPSKDNYDRSSDPCPLSGGASSPDFDDWLYEQREARAMESRLDRYYEGYGIPEHRRRWQIFAYDSGYSPLRLATLPKQPCPRDLPAGMDPKMFSYVDAFEDLLAESSGRPMMDLQTRYQMNKLLARMWPRGEHPMSWISRLESQDLSKAYFSYHQHHHHPASDMISGWGVLPREEDRRKLSWRAAPDAFPSSSNDDSDTNTPFFSEVDKVFKTLRRVLDDEISSFGRWSTPEPRKEGREQEPKTEDDLYSLVQSSFNDAERSLSNLLRSFSEAGRDLERSAKSLPESSAAPSALQEKPSPPDKPEPVEAEEVQEDETGRTVRKRKEFVDWFGNRHVKTDVRRTDRDGNLVSREVHYNVGPSPQTGETQDESAEMRSLEDDKKKSGWFWK